MRAEFERKNPKVYTMECVIEKVVCLPAELYTVFTQNLLESYDFLEENKKYMWVENDVWHCILVTGEGLEEGVLVQSEGASYARYSSFVPCILGISAPEKDISMERFQEQKEGEQQVSM